MKHDFSEPSSLLLALRIQEQAALVGMDWKNTDDIKAKLMEELDELAAATSPKERQDEFGDVLFTIVNYGRRLGINPEDAMQEATRKFSSRFQKVERMVQERKKDWSLYTAEELDELWQQAKKEG